MIKLAELVNIGKFGKTHGIKGEINMIIPDIDPCALRCIVADVDGIFVPFFLSSVRDRGNGAYLVMIDRMDSEDSASIMVNKEIFALHDDKALDEIESDTDNDGMYASDLIGYTVLNDNGLSVGVITDVDDTTENILFIVESPDGKNIMIPVAAEFIEEIIPESHTILMVLPEGLLDQ